MARRLYAVATGDRFRIARSVHPRLRALHEQAMHDGAPELVWEDDLGSEAEEEAALRRALAARALRGGWFVLDPDEEPASVIGTALADVRLAGAAAAARTGLVRPH
jgi:hypothetical protein